MGRGLPVSIPLGGAWLTGSSPHLYPILFSITLFTPSLPIKLEVPLRQQNRGTPFQSAQTWFLLAQFCLQEIEITKGTHSPFGSWLYSWPYCFQARPDTLRYREAHGKKGKNREYLSPPDGWGHNNPMTHVPQSSGRTLSHPGGAGPRSSPTDWMLDPCRPQQWPIPRLTRKPFGQCYTHNRIRCFGLLALWPPVAGVQGSDMCTDNKVWPLFSLHPVSHLRPCRDWRP